MTNWQTRRYVVFCLVIFIFNQSKNNAVLEPKKNFFRGLVDFKAQAKEGRPRGQERVGELLTLVDSVEEEYEQEVFIELGEFNDCIEEKEDTDFLAD